MRVGSSAAKKSARSPTVRAIGPHMPRTASWPGMPPVMPLQGNRSSVGLSAVMPQKCAGMRRLPPMSVPIPRGLMPDAIAAASPPELPPGERPSRCGFFVSPKIGLRASEKSIVCETFVRPSTIAPASLSAVRSAASRSARWSFRLGIPSVVASPATSKHSLIVIGRPCKAERTRPALRSVSAFAAA